MKRTLFLIFFFLIGLMASFAQNSVTLTFACRTTNGSYVQPDSILINNVTRNWTETIYYPDTVYTLTVGVGIQNRLPDKGMQVMPNPFDGTTRVNIQSPKTESVRMMLTDISGRVCAEYSGVLLEGGNLFTVALAVPQTYVLSVQTSSGVRSLKMENVGRAGTNRIAYEGAVGGTMSVVQLKSDPAHAFQLGDEMRYQGYSSSRVSYEVRKNQNTDEPISLMFDLHGVSCNGVSTLRDYDGNVYNAVQVGSQCWMKENLRTTHYADGESIALTSVTPSFDVAYRYVPVGWSDDGEEESGDVSIYGYLYNWKAVMHGAASSQANPSGVQGICPAGWHVPSNAEFTQLNDFVSNNYNYQIAKAVASDFGWNTDFISNDYDLYCYVDNNLSGFSMVPAGAFYNPPYYSNVENLYFSSVIWSSTEVSTYKSSYYFLSVYDLNLWGSDQPCYAVLSEIQKTYGFSVRCLKDDYQPVANTTPTVVTDVVSNITTGSADCGGNVTSDGGAPVTSRGVCWSTNHNPTVSGSHTTNGTGLGSFTSHLTGLSDNTTYYVRAYAKNNVGTAYGDEVTFTTSSFAAPTVTTLAATNVNVNSASCGGNVVSDGGTTVTARGLCWSTTPNPTVAGNSVAVGSGTGSFTYTLTGLTANTTYHVRAYATNSGGTAYGDDVTFTTLSPSIPTITTATVTNVAVVTASCGGNVVSNGGSPVTARGVCWSTTPNPTLASSTTTNGTGTGPFTSSLTGLTANTTYYVRAYATNSVGTAYGNQVTFTTVKANIPCPGTPTLTDYDGNVYNTVQIGNQCWMKENLRTTHYMDGTPIVPIGSYLTSSVQGVTDTIGIMYVLKSLFNWNNANNNNPSNVQSVCPSGWHLPSVAEFRELFTFVKNQDGFLCNGDTSYIGYALGSSNSNSCSWINNATGFSSSHYMLRTCTNNEPDKFYYVYFGSQVEFRLSSGEMAGVLGAAVRCVRNEGVSVTTFLDGVTTTSASVRSKISNTGTGSVVSHGVCWNTSPSPVIGANNVVYGNVPTANDDTLLITGLAYGQHYYVRAFANTNSGVVYGNEILVHLACHGDTPLMDYDSNVYHSVQIGNQCWMQENLRSMHYADGADVYYSSPWVVNQNTNLMRMLFGNHYTWGAVMRNSSSSSGVPSGVQGICPNGWHVPSDGEWTILTDYVSGQSQYTCGGTGRIAKALASDQYWSLSTSSCAPGTIGSTPNNATGFSAKAIFRYSGGGSSMIGNRAEYCSATQKDNDSVWICQINYNNPAVYRKALYRNEQFSVRCVLDNGWVETVVDSVTNILDNSAVVHGNVPVNGGNTITSKGICWSVNADPTINDQHQLVGYSPGSFTSSLNGLVPGTIYHVRVYAVTSNGVSYSNDFVFVTSNSNDAQPCANAPAVSDYDGNVYNTVQIGSQCWLKENLRTTHYSNGDSIVFGNSTYGSVAYRCYPDNDSLNLPVYGYLYNWKAVMHNASSSITNPSGVQGICPQGWHVPSQAELQQLVDYVKSQQRYWCNGSNYNVGKALADSVGWGTWEGAGPCAICAYKSDNNATGFSARGAGYVIGNSSYDFYFYSYIWSSTYKSFGSYSDSIQLSIIGSYGGSSVSIGRSKGYGSVRCVKN